jgi:GT2 family glycosyltransferase
MVELKKIKNKDKSVSIVSLTYNKLDYTKKCLNALHKNTPKEYLDDVIVVDNNSTDETQSYLKSLKWVRLIANKENLGFSGGCNQGAKAARGDILLFLNNDTEVRRGWLEPMLEALKNEKVAVTGSKLLFPDGLVQHAGVVIANDHIPRPIYYRESADRPYVNKEREFKVVTAACMAIKKKVFEEVGGFDEVYKNGMEDVDLCLKVFHQGYKTIYCPKSVVVHYESISHGRHEYDVKNIDILLKKWGQEEPDEQRYYKEDGRNWFYRRDRELVNKYYNVYYGEKPIPLQIPGYCYRFFHKMMTGLSLVLTLNFGELKQRMSK